MTTHRLGVAATLRRVKHVLLLCLLVGGCAASTFRETVTPAPAGTRKVVPWTLNRELLTPMTKQIVFVVELMAGDPFEPRALDDLAALAARYGGRPAKWISRGKDDPFAPAPDTTYVFVKYVANQLPMFGLAYGKRVGDRNAYFIIVNQARHRRWNGFLPERKLEMQTLIHEYGHLLGLPTLDHGYYPQYPLFDGGMHCVNPQCPLSKPRPRAILYNAPRVAFGREYAEDYCDECKRAIAEAQALWSKEGS